MALHVYCIVRQSEAAPDLHGLHDAPVLAVDAGPIALWCSHLEAAPVADAATLRTHNAVITAAMSEQHTPVPVRFGQSFPDAGAARSRTLDDVDRWTRLLDRFAGHVEFGVRVPHPRPGSAAREMHSGRTHSGTAYMAALAERHSEESGWRALGAGIVAEIAAATAGIATDQRTSVPTPAGLVSVAHLVARSRRAAYHEALEVVRRGRPDLQFLFTGPWPPYTFVE
jgi:hypothetical protein